MKEELLAFIEAYQEMRSLQRMYFATRDKPAMYKAKEAEKELDKKAVDIRAQLKNHIHAQDYSPAEQVAKIANASWTFREEVSK